MKVSELFEGGMSKAARAADTEQSDREYIAAKQKRKAAKEAADKAAAKPKKTCEELDETVQLEEADILLEAGNVEKALKNKAEATKIAYGILKQVFNRGAAAWRQHHRPGVGQIQWAMGRVNSFITGKGQARKADKDLWAKA